MKTIRSGILVGLGALALSGCAVFSGTPTASQQKTIGNVAITFTVCASQTSTAAPSGSCSNTGNSHQTAYTDQAQLWLGFRVPAGTVAPASFSSTSTGPSNTGPQTTFTSSSAYAGELQRLQPAPSGEEWVGYVSQYVDYNSATGEQNFTATADFGLPQAKNGTPFAGPFTYQLVVGGREYHDGTAAPTTPPTTEPIDCNQSATGSYSTINGNGQGSGFDWICVDDQSPSVLGTDATLATRDAGIVPGKMVRVTAGKKAQAHFNFEYSGSAPGATFTLSGRTTVRRTKATPSPKSVTPSGTGTTPVSVTVPVPAGTRAGTYTVKLTATLADGESRSGIVKLVVKAPKRVKAKAKARRRKSTSPTFTG